MYRFTRPRSCAVALGIAIGLACAAPVHAAGKTLVYCSEASPDTLNPQLTSAGSTFDAASTPIYNTLVAREVGSAKIVPSAAAAWEVSDDGLAYTFRLRRNVAFHTTAKFRPTRPMNADDVLFSFLRMHDPAHPFHKMTSGRVYVYYENKNLRNIIDRIEKVDEHTVRFRLKQPDAAFLAHLAAPFAVVMSAEYAQRMAAAGMPAAIDTDPVGTGPFQLVSYQKDAALRYKAFPAYWGGRAKIDNLVFAITPDASVRYAKVKKGECHLMALPKPADVQAMRNDPALAIASVDGGNVGYIGFNVEKKPFDNKLVRQALNLATDKARILKTVYQQDGRIAKNPLPPMMWGYNDKLPGYGYDPAKAKELLAKAGYPDGFEVELWFLPVSRPYNPDGKRIGEMIQDDWAKVGVKVKLVSFEWGEYLKRMRAGEHQAVMHGWSAFSDPDDFIGPLLSCAAAKNSASRWCHAEFDRLFQKSKQLTRQAERARLFEQMQAIFQEEAPWIPIAHAAQITPMRKNVTGYVPDPDGTHDFYTVDLK